MATNLASSTELLQLLGDPSRLRLLALLERRELTVAELTSITSFSQSRVSSHLGRLREAGLVRDRRAGASSFYGLNDGAMPAHARAMWDVLKKNVRDALLEEDEVRCASVLKSRNGAATWPDSIAGQMERHYSPGRTWEATARGFLGFVSMGDVLDVGAGDGTLAELLAPRAKSYTCLDKSERVLSAARERLAHLTNVSFENGEMEALPFPTHSFDEALLFNVLTYADKPQKALREVARVLRPGGRVSIVTLAEHDHAETVAAYGHVNQGFKPASLRQALQRAGFDVDHCALTSREPRTPNFQVVTAYARLRN